MVSHPVRIFLLSLFPVIGIHLSHSQVKPAVPLAQYNLVSWSTKDGLPNNKIKTMCQTRDGYVWFGTQEGLVRFDGVRFETFDQKNTPAFTHNEIISIVEDSTGILWIGTIRGLVKYFHGVFTPVPADPSIGVFICNTLFLDHNGNLLIGSRVGLLTVRNGMVAVSPAHQNLKDLTVTALTEDQQGTLWVGTNVGLKVLRGGELHDVPIQGFPRSIIIYALCLGKDQTLWVGTAEGLYFLRNSKNRQCEKLSEISSSLIHSLYTDRTGSVWIGTEKNGLYRFMDGSLENLSSREGLSAVHILSLMEDHEGNIWAGTYYHGVNKLWRGKFESYSTPEGLAGPQVWSIFEGRGGSFWIGTETGLSHWKNGVITNYTTQDGLLNNQIRSVYVDSRGKLWIGMRKGLSQFNGRTFKNYTTQNSLTYEYVRGLTEDFEGNLWVAYAEGGIDRLRNGRFENLEKEGIPATRIRVVYRGRDNTMWAGYSSGLARWQKGKTTLYDARNGIPSDVFAIYEDDDRTVWLGTFGDGLFRLKGDKIFRYTSQDGLFDDTIYQILEDDDRHLWMSSNKGVFRISRKSLNEFADKNTPEIICIGYGTADGMRSSECNGNSQPAGIRASDGKMWFPTTNGVAILNPDDIPLNSVPPPVKIESISIDNQRIPLTQKILVLPGYSYLEIHYTGLSFIVSEKILFKFKLEGFNKEWKEVGMRRAAYFTNIPPGEYTFRVQARNSDGYWNEQGASLQIELEPYFYQTTWFSLLCVVVVLATVGGIYRARVMVLKRREEELQTRVNEAIAKIKTLHGLIPICAKCKKIRDDKGYWSQLEAYIHEHSEAEFSHGICPDCMNELYGHYKKLRQPE
ncbi:MAG: two-component regulator propeller domain-containing protein [bacterium]